MGWLGEEIVPGRGEGEKMIPLRYFNYCFVIWFKSLLGRVVVVDSVGLVGIIVGGACWVW